MAALLGITLPELLGTPPGVLNILPASALRFIRQPGLRLPALERGLPFRFFNQRAPQAAGEQIEGQSGNWVLQIDCPEVFVPLPFEPGIFVAETTTTPAFLKRFPPPPADPQLPAG